MISSTEVSQLIAQNAANIQAMNSAHMQAMYPSTGVGPGLAPPDPNGFAQQIPSMAASAATYAGGLPTGLGTALSLAAAFGYAPRMLDPFTQALHAAKSAAAFRGGLMTMPGIAAGVGAAAVTMGGYYAAGTALDYLAFDPFKTGAQMRGMTLGAIHSFMPAAPMSSMASTAAMMENLQRQSGGMYGLGDQVGLLGLGVSGGDIRTADMSSFQSDFKMLVSKTKEVAQALSTSLTEAYGAMREIRSLGVSDVTGTAYTMRGLGVAGGISPAEMMGIARGGSALAKQAGISRDIGVSGAMSSAALFGYVGQTKGLGEDFGLEDLGTFQNASYRFFGSRQGTRVLAAMMNQRGEIDDTIAAQISQGTISQAEIKRLSDITLNKRSDLFGAKSSEIVSTYLSQYGPQGIVNPLMTMTQGASNPLSTRQALTGLNQEQLQEIGLLSSQGASLKQQIANAALEGFNQGTQRLSLQDQLSLAVSKMTAPVREKFSQMGASVAQSIAESIEDVTKDFVTRPTGVGTSMMGMTAINSALSTGNVSRAAGIYSTVMSSGGIGGGVPRIFSPDRSFRTGALSGFMPRALTAEAYDEQIELLPTTFGVHGLASHRSLGDVGMEMAGGMMLGGRGISTAIMGMEEVGSAGALLRPLARAGTRNIGYLGRGIDYAGRTISGLAGGAEIGLTGVGMAAGSVRAAGGLVRLAGLGTRLLGPAGAALAVKDAAEMGVRAGHYINALSGLESFEGADFTTRGQMLRLAQEAGIADPNEVMRIRDSEAMSRGMVEIGGTAGVSRRTRTDAEEFELAAENARVLESEYSMPSSIPFLDNAALVNDPIRTRYKAGPGGVVNTARNIAALNPDMVIGDFARRTGASSVQISQMRAIAADPTKTLSQKQQEIEAQMFTAGGTTGTGGQTALFKKDVFAFLQAGGAFNKANMSAREVIEEKLDAKTEDSSVRAARNFLRSNLGPLEQAAQQVILEGKIGTGSPEAFEAAVLDKVGLVGGLSSNEVERLRGGLASIASAQERGGFLMGLGGEPLRKGIELYQKRASAQFTAEKGEVRDFMSMAAGSAGMTGVVSEASKSLFEALGNENVGPVQRTQAMTEFYEKMIDSKATAEQLGAFTSRMGMSRTELGIDIAAAGAGYTRMAGLEERFFGKGQKGNGKQWAEAFLNVNLSGTGIEDWAKGKSNTATAEARLRIEQGLIDMLRVQSGGALSPDQVRTAQSNVQKVLDHMKGGGDIKDLARTFHGVPGSAKPIGNDAQQAKLMTDFNTSIDNVTKKMELLAKALPGGGGASPTSETKPVVSVGTITP